MNGNSSARTTNQDVKEEKDIILAVESILSNIGDDPDREGLQRTPQRFAQAIKFLTQGYGVDPISIINDAIFTVETNDMVIVRDINVSSLCEHHLLPFTGKAHIGYVPSNKVLGLSKFARLMDVFARRLQVQERLTRQVADALQKAVQPEGVIVVMECEHMCKTIRGVQQPGTTTITQSRTGVFERDQAASDRFWAMLKGPR